MATPARFPFGVTNSPVTSPFGQYGVPFPAAWHTYFNDFDHYTAAQWTVTLAGAGTQALTDEDGGVILLTNAAADDNSVFVQKVGESFKFVLGKKLIFAARLKVSDATQSDFVMGLQITDTTPLAVSDGVFFQKDDGDAFLDFHVEKNGTASDATALATIVSDTYLEVAFYFNGKDEVQYFTNGIQRGTLPLTNLVDDEELTVSYGVQNGEAVAKTMNVDYIFAAKER